MTTQDLVPLEHYDLDDATATRVQNLTQQFRMSERRSGAEYAARGAILLELKSLLPHGQFISHVESVLNLEQSRARRMMLAASLCAQNVHYARFDSTVLDELAAENCPESVRTAALAGAIPAHVAAIKEAKRQATVNGSGRAVSSASDARSRAHAASGAQMDERMFKFLYADESTYIDPDALLDALAERLADQHVRGDMAAARNAAETIGDLYIGAAKIAANMLPIYAEDDA